ncbi:Detected protein of confused Function [Hibiscus syriacus]|uniref:protein O-GlcNAc transferase n=1 Tax=Hibiscus syriacus TaxID=106335 RepID=A0A6A3BBF5_HIBSY|nr:Detected protein of confused Function [Hibiscus syriacus]
MKVSEAKVFPTVDMETQHEQQIQVVPSVMAELQRRVLKAEVNLAYAYKDSGDVETAVKSYKQALFFRPNFPEANCNLLHTLQCVRNGEKLDKMFTEVEGIIRRHITTSVHFSVQPFYAIAYPIDPMLALDISLKYVVHWFIIASRFACCNPLYQIDPEIFNTWCNILKCVPNSAHWLLKFPVVGEIRLRVYAAAEGVQPDQIIFTDVTMKQEHSRHSALADLCLDTPLCNKYTTGTNALWAGLSMVILPLKKMVTRFVGSLCLATGLDMIVHSMKDYEEGVVEFALNRPRLQSLTSKLKEVCMTWSLFDTARWVQNLERAYFTTIIEGMIGYVHLPTIILKPKEYMNQRFKAWGVKAQSKMEIYRNLKVEGRVYLKFQSYHQTSLALRKGLKLVASLTNDRFNQRHWSDFLIHA